MQYLFALVVGLVGGFIAWITTEFVGGQIARFRRIRGETIEALHFTANVGSIDLSGNRDHYDNAVSELRRCASRLEAIRLNGSCLTLWFLATRGYDVARAAQGLTGYSNSLANADGSRAFHRYKIEQGLKLGHEMTAEEVEETRRLEQKKR